MELGTTRYFRYVLILELLDGLEFCCFLPTRMCIFRAYMIPVRTWYIFNTRINSNVLFRSDELKKYSSSSTHYPAVACSMIARLTELLDNCAIYSGGTVQSMYFVRRRRQWIA